MAHGILRPVEPMATYEIDVPEGVPSPVTVRCDAHDVAETFERSRRTLPFHCPECETEVEITLHDTDDWRALSERC